VSRSPSRIRQSEIARAARVAKQLGPSYCVEVIPETGTIRIVQHSQTPTPVTAAKAQPSAKRDFDLLLATFYDGPIAMN
jgi:hypothetical protein